MGLILDTSMLIASERRGESVDDLFYRVRALYGEVEVAISAVTIVELTHGIYRAKTEAHRKKRQVFSEKVFADIFVQPVTLEIAQRAGRIEGEETAKGNIIAFEDLVIGATALHLGFDLATLNIRHFKAIPGLNVVTF